MIPAGALMGCRMCGEERLIQVFIIKKRTVDGAVKVDVEVSDRDAPLVESFWRGHRAPFALATR